MPDWQNLLGILREHDLDIADAAAPQAVAGGDINPSWRVTARDRRVFLKTAPAAQYPMLAAEAQGLEELKAAGAVRVPEVLALDCRNGDSLLALEWLELEPPDAAIDRTFGEQLACLHSHMAERYGWHRDNTIGLTPQQNPWAAEWLSFFDEHRLGFQLELAARNGFAGLRAPGHELRGRLDRFFRGYSPPASLLHGDLWAGNYAASGGAPVIYDPAVYFGDRESDIAMTRLFGGFGPAFYAAYEEAWPMAAGHEQRMLLYQLYHVLNHLNLFGSGYLRRAQDLIARLLQETSD